MRETKSRKIRDLRLLIDLLNYMRKQTDAVISVKLSPDMPNDQLLEFAKIVCRGRNSTCVNLGNTTYRKCTDLGLPEDAISIKGGGYSGPELYNRTLEMVQVVRKEIHSHYLKIFATGGINSAPKAEELLSNGADILGIATGVIKDMYCIPIINKKFQA